MKSITWQSVAMVLLPLVLCSAVCAAEPPVASVRLVVSQRVQPYVGGIVKAIGDGMRVRVMPIARAPQEIVTAVSEPGNDSSNKWVAVIHLLATQRPAGGSLAKGAESEPGVAQIYLSDLGLAVEDKEAAIAYDETVAVRLQKVCVEAVARCLGMKACLNPFCVMREHQDLRTLDAKGRTLCPPCLELAAKKIAAAGFSLLPQPEFDPKK